MRKLDHEGSLLLPLIIVVFLLMTALGFAVWAFAGRQDYKNNSDKKAEAAVKIAIAAEDKKKAAEYAIAEKSPVKSYTGPITFGSVNFDYPKTWSAYVSEASTGTTLVDAYFNPGVVPDVQSTVLLALRFQIVNTLYDTILKNYEPLTKSGKVSVTAYRAPKVSSALGSLITGEIKTSKQGALVLLPVRDKTIIIWTEGNDYRGDFSSIVLASLSFVP